MRISRGFMTSDVVLVSWTDVLRLIFGKTIDLGGTIYTMRRSVFDRTRKALGKKEGCDLG